MGVNTVPRFIEQPKTWKIQVSAANTNISGNTGTLVTLLTGASPNGSKVDFFSFHAQGETQVNRLRLYLFTDGGTPSLWNETSISANSSHAVDKSLWTGSLTPVIPLIVPSGWSLQIAIHSANIINIFGIGGNF